MRTTAAGSKAANSLQHAAQNKANATSSKPGAATVVQTRAGKSKGISNKLTPGAPATSSAPAQAGQKKASAGKPGPAAATQAKVGQSKAAATAKAAESSESSDSSEGEEGEKMPAAKLPAPKSGEKPMGLGCIS